MYGARQNVLRCIYVIPCLIVNKSTFSTRTVLRFLPSLLAITAGVNIGGGGGGERRWGGGGE